MTGHFGFGRPVVYGEYPYYRAEPDRWSANLAALAGAGVDIVTCYVPWRFHEVSPHRYDFTGDTDRQRDLVRLLDLATAHGLRVLLKPGPFVHGEVQLGGLPDRVSPAVDARYAAVLDAWGKPVVSQGLALPSLYDDGYRAEVGHWLSAVGTQVLRRYLAPHGPVVAVQLGNEGIYSDANRPASAHDFCAPAVAAFQDLLAEAGSPHAGAVPKGAAANWPAELKAAWAEHSGAMLRDQYLSLAAKLAPEVRRATIINLPLPVLAPPAGAAASWLLRTGRLAETGLAEGYTAWVGNASRSRTAFSAHWFGVRARRSDNVEENWGFTWTDPSFARPENAFFHAMLALALGSSSCSVYTACATEHWGRLIDLDPEGVRADGGDPLDFAPPYCPGAPLREDGSTGANLAALHALRDLVRGPNPWAGTRFAPDAALLVPDALARAEAWSDDAPPAGPGLPATVQTVMELIEDHQYQVDVLTEVTARGADPRLPWIVPDPGQEPDERFAALLAGHRRAGGTVVVLTAETDAVSLARLLPAPRYAHPESGPAVVFVHEDGQGQPVAVFAFNLTAEAQAVSRVVRGREVRAELPPHAATYLCWVDGEFVAAASTARLAPAHAFPVPPDRL